MADDRIPPWATYAGSGDGISGDDSQWQSSNTWESTPADSSWDDEWAADDPEPGDDSVIALSASTSSGSSGPAGPARALPDAYAPSARSAKPRRGAGKVKTHGAAKVTLLIVLAVVLVVGGGLAYMWFDLSGKFDTQNIDSLLGTARPSVVENTDAPAVKYPGDPYAGRAVNILVMGTDSREGDNSYVSGDDPGGARADATFVAHVSADRQRVDIVSFPRDVLITMPDCVNESGELLETAGWGSQLFNSAFSWAIEETGSVSVAAACQIKATEELSDLLIDAFVVLDFVGFVDVVNAVGGIDVTVQCPIYSPDADELELPAGEVHLDGYTAVQVARARTGDGLGDGSDPSRIHRQQVLIKTILDKIVTLNYITDFPKLYSLVSAVLGSLTTNLGADLMEIAGFGYSLKDLSMANVFFETIPVGSAPDGNRLIYREWEGEPLWEALRTDQPMPGTQPVPAETEAPPDPGTAGPSDPGTASSGTGQTPEEPTPTETAPPSIQSEYDCW